MEMVHFHFQEHITNIGVVLRPAASHANPGWRGDLDVPGPPSCSSRVSLKARSGCSGPVWWSISKDGHPKIFLGPCSGTLVLSWRLFPPLVSGQIWPCWSWCQCLLPYPIHAFPTVCGVTPKPSWARGPPQLPDLAVLLGILHPTADAGKHPEARGCAPESKGLNFLCAGRYIP